MRDPIGVFPLRSEAALHVLLCMQLRLELSICLGVRVVMREGGLALYGKSSKLRKSALPGMRQVLGRTSCSACSQPDKGHRLAFLYSHATKKGSPCTSGHADLDVRGQECNTQATAGSNKAVLKCSKQHTHLCIAKGAMWLVIN